jgi:hypothetical protein
VCRKSLLLFGVNCVPFVLALAVGVTLVAYLLVVGFGIVKELVFRSLWRHSATRPFIGGFQYVVASLPLIATMLLPVTHGPFFVKAFLDTSDMMSWVIFVSVVLAGVYALGLALAFVARASPYAYAGLMLVGVIGTTLLWLLRLPAFAGVASEIGPLQYD